MCNPIQQRQSYQCYNLQRHITPLIYLYAIGGREHSRIYVGTHFIINIIRGIEQISDGGGGGDDATGRSIVCAPLAMQETSFKVAHNLKFKQFN